MKKILIIVSILPILTFGLAANAQLDQESPCPPGATCLKNPFRGGDTLFELLRTIINDILLPVGGILAVLAFIYSGFLYVTAQGNDAKIKTAHKALLYTAIGTVLLLGAWVFASVICKTIGQLGGPICPPSL